MKARTQELTVGVFVVIAIVALFFLAMRVSGLVSVFGNNDTYTITTHFDNIGSLSPRAKVALSGVAIGKVRSIEIDQKRLDAKVTLDIYKSFKQISTDSYASITTAGLLGEQFISIEPGADETFLKEGDVLEQTQSAMVLEDLIRQFVMNKTSEAVAETDTQLETPINKATTEKNTDTQKPAQTQDDDAFGDF